MSNKPPNIVSKEPRDIADPYRSEMSLLHILIERNPERAKVIIDRILAERRGCKPNSIDTPAETV